MLSLLRSIINYRDDEQTRNMNNELLSDHCSCTECDSLICFAKRRQCQQCSCENCTKSQSCLVYRNKNKNRGRCFDKISAAYLNRAKSAIVTKELEDMTTDYIDYETDIKTIREINEPLPKSFDEYMSRLLLEIKQSYKFKYKPTSLKDYIEIISENTQFKSKQTLLTAHIINLKESKAVKPSHDEEYLEINPRKRHCSKVQLDTSKKRRNKCKGKCKHRNLTHVQSVMISYPLLELKTDNTPFSAQVINVAHGSNSISTKRSEISKDNILDYDIFKKLKDAYRECSCKVCECIPSKVIADDVCKCKPCECDQCTSYILTSPDRPELNYTCNRYNKQIRQVLRDERECSCEPCECVQCHSRKTQKSCNCTPCECVECRPNLELTALVQSIGQTACQCSPCDCIECVRGKISSIPLKIEKHRELTVRGKQNIQKQTGSLIKEIYHHEDAKKQINNDMITMYTSLSHSYPNFGLNLKANCSCEDCECITCVCEKNINAIKSSRLFSSGKDKLTTELWTGNPFNGDIKNICSCKACDCQVCIRSKLQNERMTSEHETCCVCDDCKRLGQTHAERCRCTTCRCERCFGDETVPKYTHIGSPYSIKKGDVLTPSAHQTKIQNLKMKTYNLLNTSSKTIFNSNSNCESLKQKISINSHIAGEVPGSSIDVRAVDEVKKDIGTMFTKSLTRWNILQCDAYVQSFEKSDQENLVAKHFMNKTENYVPCNSLTDTVSKTSFLKNNDSVVPILENNNFSESSLYSLGQSNPEYAIQFPKPNLEESLKSNFNSGLINYLQSNTHTTAPEEKYAYLKDRRSIKQIETGSTYSKDNENTEYLTNRNINGLQKPHYIYVPKEIISKIRTNDCKVGIVKNVTNINYENLKMENQINADELESTTGECIAENKLNRLNVVSGLYGNSILSNATVTYRDSLTVDEDCKRVQKTLKDTKEFSLHLLRVLEMYDKANKEFEKVTDKLKVSYAALFKERVTQKAEECNALIERLDEVKDSKAVPYSPQAARVLAAESPVVLSHMQSSFGHLIMESANDCETISQRLELTNVRKDISNHKSLNVNEIITNIEEATHISNETNEIINNKNVIEFERKSFDHEINNVVETFNKEDSKKCKKMRKRICKKCHKIIRRNSHSKSMKKRNSNYCPAAESAVCVSEILKDVLTVLTQDNFPNKGR